MTQDHLLRGPALPQRLVVEFRNRIVSGEWAPGSKLPPERNLCETFGVSRSVVREAISALVCLGILRTRQGGGVYVCSERDASFIDALTFVLPAGRRTISELMTVRKALEPLAAAIATRRRDPDKFAAIEKTVTAMQQAQSLGDRVTAGVAFHHAIARATDNDVLIHLITGLIDLFVASHKVTLRTDVGKLEGVLDHEGILAAMRSGNPDVAHHEMLLHLENTEDLLNEIAESGTATGEDHEDGAIGYTRGAV